MWQTDELKVICMIQLMYGICPRSWDLPDSWLSTVLVLLLYDLETCCKLRCWVPSVLLYGLRYSLLIPVRDWWRIQFTQITGWPAASEFNREVLQYCQFLHEILLTGYGRIFQKNCRCVKFLSVIRMGAVIRIERHLRINDHYVKLTSWTIRLIFREFKAMPCYVLSWLISCVSIFNYGWRIGINEMLIFVRIPERWTALFMWMGGAI